jgi:hypothetical protein
LKRTVESYLKKLCATLGWLCLKWVRPGHNGVPDRIVIGAGRTWLVELKKPGEEPTALQASVHADIRKQRVEVYVLNSRAAVLSWARAQAEACNA